MIVNVAMEASDTQAQNKLLLLELLDKGIFVLIMNKRNIILFFIALTVFFAGCKVGEKKPNAAKQKEISSKLVQKNQLLAVSYFYDALKEQNIENFDKASELFQKCLALDPNNDVAMYELARIYSLKNDFKSSLPLIEKAASINPKNKWYQIFLADVYLKNEKYSDAVRIYNKLIKDEPDNVDYYDNLASVYIYQGKLNDAIGIYDQLEGKVGVTEEVSAQKQKIYLYLKKPDKAAEEIKKLILLNPGESRYYSMLAELYISNNMPQKALEAYQKVLEIEPENPYIHVSLADFYRKQGDTTKSFSELKLGFQNPKLDIDTKIQILLTYYSFTDIYTKLKDEAFTLGKIMLEAHPAEPKAHAIYADFLARQERFNEARNEFRISFQLDSSKYLVMEQLLRLDAQLEDYLSLSNDSKRAIDLFSNQPMVYLFNGVANYQLKNYDQAVKSLSEGVKWVVDDTLTLSDFYVYLGDVYNQLKNYPSSDDAYDKALKLRPDNAYVLNNYSYYLSLRDEKLDEAEKMAKRASELNPNSFSNQDTYGWVLYKLGKLHDAQNLVRSALENGGNNDAIILEHYGDILYKLGETAEALEYWQKAKKAGKGSDLLEKKIIDKKLYE